MENHSNNRNFMKSGINHQDKRADSDMAQGVPQPKIQKPCKPGAKILSLPKVDKNSAPHKSFFDCTLERCSRRVYNSNPLTLDELSFLLWCTQGIKKIIPGFRKYIPKNLGRNYLRPAPSVTNPFETYLLILNVKSLTKGLYRYLPLSHELVFEKSVTNAEEELISIFSNPSQNQSYTTKGGVVFFWSCLPYRGEWRSKGDIHKIMLLDLGHMAQNLYLASEALECGCCEIGGYFQEKADRLLGIDGKNEFTVLAASAGHYDDEQKDPYKNIPDVRDNG